MNLKRIAFLVILSFLILLPHYTIAQKKYVVVLDAGHGGSDPGKVGYKGLQEKGLALKITKLIGKEISQKSNIKVVYTRTKDKFVKLVDRGRVANKANADLFVSIHCNAHHSKAHGTESWVLGLHANKKNFEVVKRENSVILLEDNHKENYKNFDPRSPESVIGLTLMQEENLDKSLLLASFIQKSFKSKLKRVDRGVKQAGFVVLHQTTMPSVLVETGFITNKNEAKYLNSKKGQKSVAHAIANAIKKYINRLEVNTIKVFNDDDLNKQKIKDSQNTNTKVVYKIQIASGTRRITTKSYNFRGLKNIERKKIKNSYKYYYESTHSYSKAQKLLKIARKKGYTSSFIVAFKNKHRISVKDARRL